MRAFECQVVAFTACARCAWCFFPGRGRPDSTGDPVERNELIGSSDRSQQQHRFRIDVKFAPTDKRVINPMMLPVMTKGPKREGRLAARVLSAGQWHTLYWGASIA